MKRLAEMLGKLDESVGGRVNGVFMELKEMLGYEHLHAGSTDITQDDAKRCLAAADACEAKVNSILSGKGLIGIGR